MTARIIRILNRCALAVLAPLGLYLSIVLVGLVPVNNDFREAPNGVEVVIVSSAIHAAIIVPIDAAGIDWRTWFPEDCFRGDTSWATHVAFGWGDADFFINTPEWSDLRVVTAVTALVIPSPSCIHVAMTRAIHHRADGRTVRISSDQYLKLVAFIKASLRRDGAGMWRQIPDAAYWTNDAFFEAHGTYHCLNTCNSWVGRGLRAAGVRTGWLTPLPKTVYFWLPAQTEDDR